MEVIFIFSNWLPTLRFQTCHHSFGMVANSSNLFFKILSYVPTTSLLSRHRIRQIIKRTKLRHSAVVAFQWQKCNRKSQRTGRVRRTKARCLCPERGSGRSPWWLASPTAGPWWGGTGSWYEAESCGGGEKKRGWSRMCLLKQIQWSKILCWHRHLRWDSDWWTRA